ncbi:MAG: RNA polymerase sigma factor [Gemmatimonadetes bacterium]|nr:RNA polymerase sigma factor [Gemmatimonadota bacterium]
MTLPDPRDADAAHEAALVARARQGESEAFEALYRSTAGRVFALCLRMSGDRERARELAHDVFVRAWEKLPGFRGEAAFSTWLHRLAVNVVLERQRGERRRQAHEEPGLDEDDETPAMRRVVRIDEGDRLDLEAAIARLPTNARTVFVLHEVQGYRHDEIAQAMAIAEGTVRAHLHRARRLLMEFLSR